MKKLYVGNLPYSASEAGLRDMFSKYGEIDSVKLIIDRDTGRSKGFGFVEFTDKEDAEKALELNGTELEGRALKVNIARPKASSGGNGGYNSGGRDRRW